MELYFTRFMGTCSLKEHIKYFKFILENWFESTYK